MDPESKKFGKGPRELTGAVDLISYYKLLPHHEFFCKKSLPLSISDTHYLHNVVGESEIRKGEGMQLDQLIQNTSFPRDTNTRILPFDMDILGEAFQLRETAPVDLPSSEKGTPTVAGKSKIIMIPVLNPQRNTMRRKGSMMEMKISMTSTDTRKVSIRAQRWMKWVQ
ncbi:hypothetical protein CTI12_AA566660 [Artemisia annua]|uniref:Uncharacterized protein n=1 Tax=Artemisia annua TaxID=35608 RepID=A0A2U1KTE3_ARTAN|nr:hypothetical protein CTI12_AA566660 [Artemisia annua]